MRSHLQPNDGRSRSRGPEWPSILLCAGVYGTFLAVTFWHEALPVPLFAALGALVLALHSSMQHEFIHGHPTRWGRLNRGLAAVPLSLWLPFETYRRVHLLHHRDDRVTDPYDDPESYYWSAEGWQALGPLGRSFIRVHSTLAGRLLLGPSWNIPRFLVSQAKALWCDDPGVRRTWLWHGVGSVVVLAWVLGVCRIPLATYLFGLVYPAASILMLRSFAEHRAEAAVPERTAVVENAPLIGFLFLYNNLHAAHHESPTLPWYALPGWYRRNRERLVGLNGGLVYDGYRDVAWRFLFTPHHVSVHPLRHGAPGETAGVTTVLPRRRPRRQAAIFRRRDGEKTSVAARSMS